MALIGGCVMCSKYILFVLNFIFWLIGCLLLAVGIWALVDDGTIREHSRDYHWEASIIIYVMITVGSIMTIIGFLGCCGAIRESRCLLTAFFIMLFIIHGIFMSAGLFLTIRRDKVSEMFPQPQRNATSNKLRTLIADSELDVGARNHMQEIQYQYKCCGADKGIHDYTEIIPNFSKPECKRPLKACTDPVFRAELKRHDDLMKVLPKSCLIAGSIILAIAVLMIFGMTLSIVLCCALKGEISNVY